MAVQELNLLLKNLQLFLPLANSHMVHFISRNMFENVIPKEIQVEIDNLEIKDLNKLFLNSFSKNPYRECPKAPNLIEFITKVQKLYLKETNFCIELEELFNCLGALSGFQKSNPRLVKNLMSMKKGHEVEMMSSIIAALANSNQCTHVVDIGGGKGYLSSFLALKHKFKVLSIDSSYTTSKGAAKRIPKVEKMWNIIEKKDQPADPSTSISSVVEAEKKPSSELCKLATLFISDDTDIASLVSEHFPEDKINGISLVGLHTCGNLAASSLRIFVNNCKDVRCLVNVGCCYHLLVEEFDLNPPWLEVELQCSGVGFPLSTVLRDQKFSLGRNARMLAAQPPERISHDGLIETEILFYRALLEVYLEKKLCPSNGLPHYRVGKIGKKCISFPDYVHKSIKRLKLDIEIDDVEVRELYESHQQNRKRLHAFFLLRLAVAPAIEAAIMIDRLMFLREQGVKEAYLTQLFDPVVSPRCHALIAFN